MVFRGISKAKRGLLDKAVYSLVVLAVLALILPSAAAVITYTDLYISIKDITTNEKLGSLPARIEIENINTGTTINLTKHIDNESILTYRINVGTWKVSVKADNLSTPELDYTGDQTFIVEENTPSSNEELYVSPAGAVEIFVTDESDKMISDAEVTVKCKSFKTQGITDQFGSEKFDAVPAGECKILAAYNDRIGSSVFVVEQGELATTGVILDQKVLDTTTIMSIIAGVLAAVTVASVAYILVKRKRSKKAEQKEMKKAAGKSKAKSAPKSASKAKSVKKEKIKAPLKNNLKESSEDDAGGAEHKRGESPEEEKPKEDAKEGARDKEELNPRARDIMKTLNERETKVVAFLLRNNNKGTQATIRTDTSIPKTSLVRVFQSLENKKVITVEHIGKLKKVILTDWFLGKE